MKCVGAVLEVNLAHNAVPYIVTEPVCCQFSFESHFGLHALFKGTMHAFIKLQKNFRAHGGRYLLTLDHVVNGILQSATQSCLSVDPVAHCLLS